MLHEALRLIRVFNDMKSIQLANKLGISPSYLSEIENGKKQPSIELIKRYSEEFKIPPSTILFFAEELDKIKHSKNFKSYVRKKTIEFLQSIENAAA